MAVNKVISNKATTHQQLRNCIAYVLRSEKVKEGYTSITGPYIYDSIDSKNVFNSFIDEKKLWNKDTGRMYMHSIISWHKNEKLTPDLALKIATNIAEQDPFYKDFQTLVAIHQDKNHIHAHLVTNTVSYKDGRK